MYATDKDFEEIFALFDSGNFESRKVAVMKLYEFYRTSYLMIIKREMLHSRYDDSLAEDVLQDTFISLLSKNTTPSSPFAIGQWLKSYVYNVARDNLKKAYRKNESTFHSDELSDDDSVSNLSNFVESGDSSFIKHCLSTVIIEYGRDYPEKAEVLSKIITEDVSYKQLSKIFGKTESNLKRIFSLASHELKDLMEPCFEKYSGK
jgi:RNA polymerase sigma factor (sigma-70 family)